MRRIMLAAASLIAAALGNPALAQNAWLTPGGSLGHGQVSMCLNSSGEAVPEWNASGQWQCAGGVNSGNQTSVTNVPETTLTAASGNKANASAAATLAATAGKTTYISGFELTAAGATTGACVNPTVTGVIGGTITYVFCAPTGVALSATPLLVQFNPPLPASAADTAIVVTLPALGSGNTNAAVVAHGYVQ